MVGQCRQEVILSEAKILLNLMKISQKTFDKVDVQYLEKLQELHNDLPFLPEKI